MKWTLLALSFVVSTTGLAQSLADRMQTESESVSLASDFCHYMVMGPQLEVKNKIKEKLSQSDCHNFAKEALKNSAAGYNKVMVEHSGEWEVFFREKAK